MSSKNLIVKLLIAAFLCAATMLAHAEPGWMRAQNQEHAKQRQERPKKMQQNKEMRRNAEWSAHRDQIPAQKRGTDRKEGLRSHNYDERPQNSGKMTPEERRALRRQINEANQSIHYRNY